MAKMVTMNISCISTNFYFALNQPNKLLHVRVPGTDVRVARKKATEFVKKHKAEGLKYRIKPIYQFSDEYDREWLTEVI